MAFPGSVSPVVETVNAIATGDFMDDPAILLHPTDTSKSVIVGTNKSYTDGRIDVYDFAGNRVESEDIGSAFNNVDVSYNFGLGSTPTAIIGASGRESGDIHFWTYDFNDTADEMTSVGTIDTGYADEPYGFTMGQLNGKTYAFVSADNGTQVKQFELDGSSGSVTGTLVRTLNFSGQIEGMVVDDQKGYFYAAEETGQIEKYRTDPTSGTAHTIVDQVGSAGHLVADIEGLTIYYGADGNGYLIASSQGESKYAVYDRNSNAYLGEFGVVSAGGIDGVSQTDGLDVTNVNLGGKFTSGAFIVHDNSNSGDDASNFKLVPWSSVASLGGLQTSTSYDPRTETGATGPVEPLPSNAPPPPPFFTIADTPATTRTFTGTSGNDTLTGTTGSDRLDGGGGADAMSGLTGGDVYVVDNPGDVVTDKGGQDTVILRSSAIDYRMPANVEHLTIEDTGFHDIIGNADDNIIRDSGSSEHTLVVNGDTGKDIIVAAGHSITMTGGDGNDIFRIKATAPGNSHVLDFAWGFDLIDASDLRANSFAPSSDPWLNGVLKLVNKDSSTAALLWDKDGSAGPGAAVEMLDIVGVQVDAGINQAHVYLGYTVA
jgi:myo-inositol-hexaphosphate 3-phosphohydrolase